MHVGVRVTGHLKNTVVGEVDFAGTVSDSYASGGRTVVTVACDDGAERCVPEDNLTLEQSNLMTHTGKVHATGAYYKAIRGRAPKCCGSVSAVQRYHYIIPTSEPVDCQRCLNLLSK